MRQNADYVVAYSYLHHPSIYSFIHSFIHSLSDGTNEQAKSEQRKEGTNDWHILHTTNNIYTHLRVKSKVRYIV